MQTSWKSPDMNMTTIRLQAALQSLPENAPEAVVDSLFIPPLLEAIGFTSEEVFPQYKTGNGSEKVDKAARKNTEEASFIQTGANPYLLVELKGRDINLSNGTAQYQATVKQLKRYLLAPNCQSAQWGIITNSCHIQLFRKHGKAIFPATECLALNEDTIDGIVAAIRQKIEHPSKALTVAIYNNKGGVGKTTTTVNLGAILTFLGKKVLMIDFDPNQQDLTSSLGLSLSEDRVFQALTDRTVELKSTISPFRHILKSGNALRFDVVPADKKLSEHPENLLRNLVRKNTLHLKLEALRQEYDYILIDAPPNWRVFSQLAVYAADVVLIPTKHNNLFSLENAATVIRRFIAEVQAEKGDGSPVALPIFFNGGKITPPQLKMAQEEIANILKAAKREQCDLLPYFFSRYSGARKDLYIPHVPSYAHIASAAFARMPAVYRDRSAHEYYKSLAKEYFLQ